MARHAKQEWIDALQALTGHFTDTIRFNELLHRWEFVLMDADGVPRSQFWGWFNQPKDPTTGLHPFRELDDDTMRLALRNLDESFVGRHAANTRQAVDREQRARKARVLKAQQAKGELFADMWFDRIVQITEQPWVGSGGSQPLAKPKAYNTVVSMGAGPETRSTSGRVLLLPQSGKGARRDSRAS